MKTCGLFIWDYYTQRSVPFVSPTHSACKYNHLMYSVIIHLQNGIVRSRETLLRNLKLILFFYNYCFHQQLRPAFSLALFSFYSAHISLKIFSNWFIYSGCRPRIVLVYRSFGSWLIIAYEFAQVSYSHFFCSLKWLGFPVRYCSSIRYWQFWLWSVIFIGWIHSGIFHI